MGDPCRLVPELAVVIPAAFSLSWMVTHATLYELDGDLCHLFS